MMKWLLEGKWLGHPLHPLLVHLPIGLYVLSLLMDVATYLVSDPDLANLLLRGAFYTMVLGTVTGLLAVFPGMADWLDIRDDHPAKEIGIYHMVLNLLLLTLYGINIAIRWNGTWQTQTRGLWLGLSIAGLVLLSISGYLGGKMVYDDGVGVGRHRRRRGKTPRKTIELGASADPAVAADGLVPVTRFDQLEERQTLRVSVNGVVMAVAKVDGEVFAFQEFCTHRYGPLSEGCFRDGKVVCPWHGSRFELATGNVAEGPAKEHLRTFRVEVRDNTVFVETPVPAPAQQPSEARVGSANH